MNIEHAKTLLLPEILTKLKLNPFQENGHLLCYSSPFSNKGSLTLIVNTESNTWADGEMAIGGDPLDFIREYLKHNNQNCSIVDVLQWLEFNIGYPSLTESISLPDYAATDKQYAFSYKSTHFSSMQVRYLTGRYIPLTLAKRYLKEVAYINGKNKRESLALGLKNEEGGFAIRSRHIKAIIGARGISVIKGKAEDKIAVHVFKDIYDYLSAVFIQKGEPFNNDAIILNSYSCLEDSGRYIRSMKYRKVYTWLGNGQIGQQATKNYTAFCAALEETEYTPMNRLYASAYDVNAWLIQEAQKWSQQ